VKLPDRINDSVMETFISTINDTSGYHIAAERKREEEKEGKVEYSRGKGIKKKRKTKRSGNCESGRREVF